MLRHLIRRLRWVDYTVCHAKWIGAWQIPCGAWLRDQVRNETDVFISESSAGSKQLLLFLFGGRLDIWSFKKSFCFELGRRLMYPPLSAAIPKCMSVPGPYPRSTTFWCWILWFSSSLWYDLARKPRARGKRLRRNPKGITGRNVWKLQFNLSFRSW